MEANNNNVNNNNGGEGGVGGAVRDPLVNVRDRLFHTLFFRSVSWLKGVFFKPHQSPLCRTLVALLNYLVFIKDKGLILHGSTRTQ